MRILVGLSGGVDSAVSALLLKQAGHTVSAGFMINYIDEKNPTCPTREDLAVAESVAKFLDIPFFTFDYRKEYESRIVQYIYREYEACRTPNPDVFCNNLIKFELFLEEALDMGFDAIATGHYAHVKENAGIYELCKGNDPGKDQSYFLSRLSQFQLSKSIFPIGMLQKEEVRKIARANNLPNAERKDSQGLCFIGKVPMREFLLRRIPKKDGKILDPDGKILGTHEGAFSYTIGQRKGIGVGGGPSLFVIAKDCNNNTITVSYGKDDALFQDTLTATEWVGEMWDGERVCAGKIRYRQKDVPCRAFFDDTGTIHIHFPTPERAITSGQILVLYDGDRVIGSGIIC